LEVVYWIRLGLGIVAALLCVGYGVATNSIPSSDPYIFVNGLMIALAFYMITYYVIKPKFILKVAKPQKLVTMGIGIYFIAWIVFWVIFYTAIAGPPLA
jgi:hypothetical protein